MGENIKIISCLKVKEDIGVVDVAKLMKKKNERRVFVVGKDDALKGIITTTDIVSKVVATKRLDLTAKEIMVKNPSCVEISESLENALGIMNKHQTFVCPVVKNKKLLGLIQYKDLMTYLVSETRKK